MNTVTVTAPPQKQETNPPLIQEISLSSIKPSQANPRRRTDEAALAELSENIKAHGILQPILVRPVTPGRYEIVCGERRWRASKAAEKNSIPARIVHLSDTEALEWSIIENLQREDVHELDEALGYKALIKRDPARYTVETIAAKVGRSRSYVYQRLRLAELTPNVQKAFSEGKLTAGHAMEIARLQPKDQEHALRECFPGHGKTTAILKDKDPQPISVHDLRHWIQREVLLSLANAPFDINDATLLPAAGPCSTCPKRSGSNPLLFADSIPRKDVCTDRECFQKKVSALVQLRIRQCEQAAEKPVRVSDSYGVWGQKAQPGVIYRSDYHEAQAAGECPTTTVAVVVDGNTAGRKVYACTNPKCPIHTRRALALTPQEKAERRRQTQALRLHQQYRKRLLGEIYQRVPSSLSRHELGFVARQFFDQVGFDNQRRMVQFLAWDEAKKKPANGASGDFPQLARVKLDGMTTAEIGRFLVVCALASDLYCPAYYSGTPLPKGSKLAREAAHYKVNGKKILHDVKERLTSKSARKKNPKSQTTAKTKANAAKR